MLKDEVTLQIPQIAWIQLQQSIISNEIKANSTNVSPDLTWNVQCAVCDMHVCVCLHVCACVCLWDVKTNCSVTQIWHKTNRIASHRIETSRVDSSRVDASWSHSIEIENRIHWVQLEQYIYIHIVYYCEFALLTRAINSQLRSVNLNSLLTLPCARMQSSIQSFSCHWHKKRKHNMQKAARHTLTHTNTHTRTHIPQHTLLERKQFS